MLPYPNQNQEIRPAAPDDLLRGLLALPFARSCPLGTGDTAGSVAREGEYALIGSGRGKLTVTAHNQYFLLSSGQAVLLRAAGSYTLQGVSDCSAFVVHLQGELAERLLAGLLQEDAAFFPKGGALVREAVLALLVLGEESGAVSGALASSHGYSLLVRLRSLPAGEQGEEAAVSPLVENAIAIIQEDFPFLEGLDDLAGRLEVSKAHLIRTFSRQTGISPARYIVRVRVEYAKLLLLDEDASITYVAEASGFANANYFAKVFRRETGMSPSEYLAAAPKKQEHPQMPQNRRLPW
ncbi:MAG: helix-turn-helix transcriptional regulator [Angelakisella sp.]|jgi:AraC-like DNA-binding protein|nr:helix-turn-helix transcriptional regulator [Angelakisella sp.]